MEPSGYLCLGCASKSLLVLCKSAGVLVLARHGKLPINEEPQFMLSELCTCIHAEAIGGLAWPDIETLLLVNSTISRPLQKG